MTGFPSPVISRRHAETSLTFDPTSSGMPPMRSACLLLIASTPLLGGCSCLVASSGKDLRLLTTKGEVRAQMGEPTRSGVVEGKAFDEYRTRRKISEEGTVRMAGAGMGFAMTFGASELITFPVELCTAGGRTLMGQDVRFVYDAEGKVTERFLDGKCLVYFRGVERKSAALQEGSTGPPPFDLTPPAAAPPATPSGASPAAPSSRGSDAGTTYPPRSPPPSPPSPAPAAAPDSRSGR